MKTANSPSFRELLLCTALAAVLGLGLAGCAKRSAELDKVVRQELDLIRDMDEETVLKYVDSGLLFPDSQSFSLEESAMVAQVLCSFFKDFDYEILSSEAKSKEGTGTVRVRLTCIDAPSLAKDFLSERIRTETLLLARGQDAFLSQADCFLILSRLLEKNSYGTLSSEYTIHLRKEDGDWKIVGSDSLENALTGGLITALSSQQLISPSETLQIIFGAVKEMSLEEMCRYLGVKKRDDDNVLLQNLQDALMAQIHTHFDYQVDGDVISGYQASVKASIRSFDADAILSSYKEKLDVYLSSLQALTDGQEKRQEQGILYLTQAVEENTVSASRNTIIEMVNDGISWKISEDGARSLASALFGSFSDQANEILPETSVS